MTSKPIVLAHNLGPRYDLPLPLYLFVVGGAVVVLLSFLLVLRRPPVAHAEVEAPDVVPARDFSPAPGLVSIVVTLLVAITGLIGTQEEASNIAPTFFWLLVWIAVPLSCGVIGDWTLSVNPFANLARLGDNAGLRKLVLARKKPLEWSAGLAWWPAFVLFVLLVLGELVFNLDTTKPAFVGALLLVYGLASFFLGLLFGPAWLERGEVFSVLLNTWGRLGWRRFGSPGREGFAGGLDVPFNRTPSRVLFVLLMLVSINFDGLLATPAWQKFEIRRFGSDLNERNGLRTLSLIVLVVVVLAVFLAFAVSSAKAGKHEGGPLDALAGLLPSLVPIAFGYLIAHNLQYLLVNLQQLYPLVKNPGFGDTTSTFSPNINVLPAKVNWYVSVAVIIIVHVIAVVIAHHYLVRRSADEQAALKSEYPWLVAMVAYTAFSLILIAQPLTQESSTGTALRLITGLHL